MAMMEVSKGWPARDNPKRRVFMEKKGSEGVVSSVGNGRCGGEVLIKHASSRSGRCPRSDAGDETRQTARNRRRKEEKEEDCFSRLLSDSEGCWREKRRQEGDGQTVRGKKRKGENGGWHPK